ncbi:MAG: hypothetical protein JWN37_172 [Candidatus Nomurabacteria bacterium]|nr:hypothetical protein [Candidatus Nomurabacteria bacterium]
MNVTESDKNQGGEIETELAIDSTPSDVPQSIITVPSAVYKQWVIQFPRSPIPSGGPLKPGEDF